jgi:hypothetical protein
MQFNDEHIKIRIVADQHRGIWANLVAPRNGRSTQTAGRVNGDASYRMLLIIALIAALRSISRRTIELVEADPHKKLRIHVATRNARFGPTVKSLLRGDDISTKIGKDFKSELIRFFDKFDIVFVDKDHGGLLTLVNWANSNMFAEDFIAAVPAPFKPVVVSQLTPHHQL